MLSKLLVTLALTVMAAPIAAQPPHKKIGIPTPVGSVLTPESIAKDMIGKETTLPDGEKWEFGNMGTEKTTVKSIKKITLIANIVRVDVEIDAHLC